MADAWIGNACVTGSGDWMVVAYAPRVFMNDEVLMQRGAFTAIVDLNSGGVTKLAVQSSLAYFNPGCGTDETAVLTQSRGTEMSETRLFHLDAQSGVLGDAIDIPAQVTSAVPVRGGIVAADGARLVAISPDGERTELVRTTHVPFDVRPDRDGGVVFVDREANRDTDQVPTASITRLEARYIDRPQSDQARVTSLAEGPMTNLGLTGGGGTVFIMGNPDRVDEGLPGSVRFVRDTPLGSTVTTGGAALVTQVEWADGQGSGVALESTEARPVVIGVLDVSTQEESRFAVLPSAGPGQHEGEGREISPLLPSVEQKAPPAAAENAVDASSDHLRHQIVEDDRYCAVPRNDPRSQPVQPKPRQVEWAVNRAVLGQLDQYISRPANWKNHGMPAYQPQTLFPSLPLDGGGYVPHQVLLGVAAQESNMRQSSWHVMPGVSGNPLIGNFYGRDVAQDGSSDWGINWADADCGYGVMQVTDHMRMAGREHGGLPAWPYEKQRAVALDYTVNVAAGLQILQDKWNQTRGEGLIVNNGSSARPENWFFALWAYNSGFYPRSDAGSNGGAWGVGWANNPANPYWKPNRTPFMDDGNGYPNYKDAATPQYWPYQEKVLGFAAYPPELLEAPNTPVSAYRQANWNPSNGFSAERNRARIKPPVDLFCDPGVNKCHAENLHEGSKNDENGPCQSRGSDGRIDHKCWWNGPAVWKEDCAVSCGYDFRRFPDGWAEEPDGTAYPPNCGVEGLPSNALVIDVQPNSVPSTRPGCSRSSWVNAGSFTMDFGAGEISNGVRTWPSKIDFHQIGGGFGGHFFLGHTREAGSATGERLKATGRWEMNRQLSGWARVMVHIPDHGAHTQQAKYVIYNGTKLLGTRYIPTRYRAHTWVNLGVFDFSGGGFPRVELANVTDDGTGADSIAWDSVAFVPMTKKPDHFIVAMGDSYSSGEGAGDYSVVSDNNRASQNSWNGCRRSDNAWARKATLRGQSQNIGILADRNDPDLDFQFIACSGARASQMQSGDPLTWGWDGQFREKSQVDSGVLDENTTLVALTLGGNDANFSTVVQDCVTPFSTCTDSELMRQYIRQAVPNTKETIRQIHRKAPNAQIRVLGYPRLFSAENGCIWLNSENKNRLNDAADYMTEIQGDMVVDLLMDEGIPVSFFSPDTRFEGNRACDNPEGIHEVVRAQKGEGDNQCFDSNTFCISRESFHPKNLGTTIYGRVFEETL
ncbi:GDSL-type esterase/lipase family protein [Streptomyces sp. NPDC059853]|uniref:golvesin C-terminal-like domain-containing protein n=1 Tax=Streptomyces sp. NPDC059853 TaxID=3346973 RepID=UPI0036622A41